ncbi:UDP-2,3-diacylglucosamine diphosphatase [bacterium endosymbiont of Pedicinus badii]|uniref:UDP-2,3-diacylglucosamine diphosphatase n=1 Tax=bacterium endosymbiont of Pedicinus badii TaxID=1719126 RepID=UPI0009BBAC0F|nr:UDP-2,3-diacylglucosamine diphosphatase [bacterium endosymbiont of Pedicinus badii]OQM34300.1 hypothetical protein AOQ89_00150 [bacterium endosymbiont of Pedicinus badii]
MKTIFVSDVHLSENFPNLVKKFLNFLSKNKKNLKFLYILGDLFDFWIGDDNQTELSKKISLFIKNLVKNGTSCYFIRGNRDFLIGKKYANSCGMKIIPNNSVLKIQGYSIIVMHGDQLLKKDKIYKIFSKFSRNRIIKNAFLKLPLKIRIKIAKILRKISISQKKKKKIFLIDKKNVEKIMNKNKASILIHGHTHICKSYRVSKKKICISLGSWENFGSMVKIEKKRISLFKFSI